MKPLLIGVIGASRCGGPVRKAAYEVGYEIGRRGHTLVCGGLEGVMHESCRGAKAAGGLTVGILPGKSKNEANPYVDIPIASALSHARNAVIVRTADALVAVGGRYGTLSEIGLGLSIDKPVFGVHTWKIPGVKRVPSAKAALDAIEKQLKVRRP